MPAPYLRDDTEFPTPDDDLLIGCVELITEAIVNFWELAGLQYPDLQEGILFIVEEVGELARAYNNVLRPDYWVRNHPKANKQDVADIAMELGDVALMALVTSFAIDANALSQMLAKIEIRTAEHIRETMRAVSAESCGGPNDVGELPPEQDLDFYDLNQVKG